MINNNESILIVPFWVFSLSIVFSEQKWQHTRKSYQYTPTQHCHAPTRHNPTHTHPSPFHIVTSARTNIQVFSIFWPQLKCSDPNLYILVGFVKVGRLTAQSMKRLFYTSNNRRVALPTPILTSPSGHCFAAFLQTKWIHDTREDYHLF